MEHLPAASALLQSINPNCPDPCKGKAQVISPAPEEIMEEVRKNDEKLVKAGKNDEGTLASIEINKVATKSTDEVTAAPVEFACTYPARRKHIYMIYYIYIYIYIYILPPVHLLPRFFTSGSLGNPNASRFWPPSTRQSS
jgi:hypothetical protein